MSESTRRRGEVFAVMLSLLFLGWFLFIEGNGKAGEVVLNVVAVLWSIAFFPLRILLFIGFLLSFHWSTLFLTQKSALKRMVDGDYALNSLACYSTSDYNYNHGRFTTDGQKIIDEHIKRLVKETIEEYK